jgi:hypothetical protein
VSKGLIIVLVVIVVLFVATIAIGASHGGSASPDHPGFAGSLKGLQGNRFLTIGDKASTTCPVVNAAPTMLSVFGTCVISIDKRGLFSTSTRVAFDANGAVSVMTEPTSVSAQLPADDGGTCFGSAVDHDGGTITLTAFTATTITVRTSACPS